MHIDIRLLINPTTMLCHAISDSHSLRAEIVISVGVHCPPLGFRTVLQESDHASHFKTAVAGVSHYRSHNQRESYLGSLLEGRDRHAA